MKKGTQQQKEEKKKDEGVIWSLDLCDLLLLLDPLNLPLNHHLRQVHGQLPVFNGGLW